MLQDYIILQLYVKGAPWSFLVNKQVKYNVYVFHPVSWNSHLGITNTTFTVCTMLQGAGRVANVHQKPGFVSRLLSAVSFRQQRHIWLEKDRDFA